MDQALQADMPPNVIYRRPDAGYFFWLRFPASFDTVALHPIARAAGVGFQPGPVFSTRDRLSNCLRLSFAYYDETAIQTAVASLGTILARIADSDRSEGRTR
jgi:DNA-binding transcriptional MocR family regulator